MIGETMWCEACQKMKPEIQRVLIVGGQEIHLACHECEEKALKAYKAADKSPEYRHSKAIRQARKKKNQP